MKVAIVYDRANKWGGAERVLLTLHEIFPEAPLFTSVYSKEHASWAEVFPRIETSFLNKIKPFRRRHEILGTFMPMVFETMNLRDYDLVISVTSEAAKGILTKPGSLHICYCLTPTRYLWSGQDLYFKNPILRFFAKPAVSYLKRWEKIAAARPDIFVGISNEVKNRIKRYYSKEAKVVSPPVDLEKFILREGEKIKKGKFFLLVSRLVSYKRADLAVSAFNRLKLPLVIVGTGSQEKKLKKMAKSNIKFISKLTDAKLNDYYKRSLGFIFPQEEDFGIVALEAQAAGTGVIAFRAGGALDTVIEGKTGVFFDKQNVESLIKAVKKFQRLRFDQKDLIKNAQRFSKEKFKSEFMKLVKKTK